MKKITKVESEFIAKLSQNPETGCWLWTHGPDGEVTSLEQARAFAAALRPPPAGVEASESASAGESDCGAVFDDGGPYYGSPYTRSDKLNRLETDITTAIALAEPEVSRSDIAEMLRDMADEYEEDNGEVTP